MKRYCLLLDRWQLWHQRARFDIARKDSVRTQIYVRCSCGQPLSTGMIVPQSPSTRASSGAPGQKQRITNCPGCKKLLPRCSICLLSFACNVYSKSGISPIANTPFDEWFTWCQTCKHGGHANHLQQWFKNHKECPVSDCNCQCSSL